MIRILFLFLFLSCKYNPFVQPGVPEKTSEDNQIIAQNLDINIFYFEEVLEIQQNLISVTLQTRIQDAFPEKYIVTVNHYDASKLTPIDDFTTILNNTSETKKTHIYYLFGTDYDNNAIHPDDPSFSYLLDINDLYLNTAYKNLSSFVLRTDNTWFYNTLNGTNFNDALVNFTNNLTMLTFYGTNNREANEFICGNIPDKSSRITCFYTYVLNNFIDDMLLHLNGL